MSRLVMARENQFSGAASPARGLGAARAPRKGE
jgi:hypothetical protein